MRQSIEKRLEALEAATHRAVERPLVIAFWPYGADPADVVAMSCARLTLTRRRGESLDDLHARAEAASPRPFTFWNYVFRGEPCET